MNKDELLKRIAEIKTAVEQSASNHHALCGRLAEAQFMLEQMETLNAKLNECPDVAELAA